MDMDIGGKFHIRSKPDVNIKMKLDFATFCDNSCVETFDVTYM